MGTINPNEGTSRGPQDWLQGLVKAANDFNQGPIARFAQQGSSFADQLFQTVKGTNNQVYKPSPPEVKPADPPEVPTATLTPELNSQQTIHRYASKLERERRHTVVISSGANGKLPALYMYINPQDLSVDRQHHITTNFVRGGKGSSGEPMLPHGWSVQHWGENLVTITASGVTGGFYFNPQNFQQEMWLTTLRRRESKAYQSLAQLVDLYRENGYEKKNVIGANRIWKLGMVRLQYGVHPGLDPWEYPAIVDWWGHFDSFSISENADSPHMLNWSFSFTGLLPGDGDRRKYIKGHVSF